jgi:hypothetical protein
MNRIGSIMNFTRHKSVEVELAPSLNVKILLIRHVSMISTDTIAWHVNLWKGES